MIEDVRLDTHFSQVLQMSDLRCFRLSSRLQTGRAIVKPAVLEKFPHFSHMLAQQIRLALPIVF